MGYQDVWFSLRNIYIFAYVISECMVFLKENQTLWYPIYNNVNIPQGKQYVWIPDTPKKHKKTLKTFKQKIKKQITKYK